MIENDTIPDRLRKIRLRDQITWEQLAEKLSLSESMIYQVIAGKNNLSDKAIHRLTALEAEENPKPGIEEFFNQAQKALDKQVEFLDQATDALHEIKGLLKDACDALNSIANNTH